MTQKISESVSVTLNYDSKLKKSRPRAIHWRDRLYPVTKVGLHHVVREGDKLLHIFSVSTPTLFFRLVFDTGSLEWIAEEIWDAKD